MKVRKLAAAAVTVPVLAGAAALAATGSAHAAVSPTVEYTAKGSTGAVAGIFAHAPSSSVNFTHITSYVGNDGGSSQEQLTPVTEADFGVGGNVPGGTIASGVVNGLGLGLCNQSSGYGAQIGQVYVGAGLVDVVYATGLFGAAVNNGDPCQNGVISASAHILMANVPVNNTVELDVLYDFAHAYSWHGHSHAAGTVTFSGTDLSATPGTTLQAALNAPRHGVEFNEADGGAVADTTLVSPLTGTVPLPDVKGAGDLLGTLAHLSLDGNTTGGSEVFGPAWSTSAWTAFYVAATKNGGAPSAGNPLYLAPGSVNEDHVRIYVGQPVG